VEYTFFSADYGTFSQTDHILGLKPNQRKYSKSWQLNNALLNDQWVVQEIRTEVRKFL
jgi:hypothetical protein